MCRVRVGNVTALRGTRSCSRRAAQHRSRIDHQRPHAPELLFAAALAVLSACSGPRVGRMIDPTPNQRCVVVAEVLRTGNSPAYRSVSMYPDSMRLAWASSFSRGCGAEGGAALADRLLMERQSTDTILLNYLVAPVHELIDGSVFRAAEEIALDAQASSVARASAIRALIGLTYPGRLPGYSALISGNSPLGCAEYHPGLHWSASHGVPIPEDAEARLERIAFRIQEAPSAAEPLSSAAACALRAIRARARTN